MEGRNLYNFEIRWNFILTLALTGYKLQLQTGYKLQVTETRDLSTPPYLPNPSHPPRHGVPQPS